MVCIRTEYGVILSISLYSVLMRENTDTFYAVKSLQRLTYHPLDSSQGNIDSA